MNDLSLVKFAAAVSIVGAVVTGCSGTGTSSSEGVTPGLGAPDTGLDARDAGSADGSSEAGTGTSLDGSLTIVSLVSTMKAITQESLATTFVAIVTSTNGLETIAGGQLMDGAGATYAAFGAGANKGTYSASLDWKTANSVAPINVPPAGGQRTFVAKFFDNAGRVATANVELKFSCEVPWETNTPPTFGAHKGECVDFSARSSCEGSQDCESDQACFVGLGCRAGMERCFNGTRAFNLGEYYPTCNDYCTAKGGTCKALYIGCEGYNGDKTSGSLECASSLATADAEYTRCICSKP